LKEQVRSADWYGVAPVTVSILPLRRRIAAALVAAFLMLLAGPGCAAQAAAQMFVTTGRDTLRGLPGIEVAVEPLPPELARRGLTDSEIRTRVEARLRAGGVTVYASQKENPSQAKPYLYLHLNALDISSAGIYAVAVQVQLRQTLQSPVTSSNVVNAMTWDAHNVVGVPAAQARLLLEEIDGYVDVFIADWVAVH
jgi:hypothetical protein